MNKETENKWAVTTEYAGGKVKVLEQPIEMGKEVQTVIDTDSGLVTIEKSIFWGVTSPKSVKVRDTYGGERSAVFTPNLNSTPGTGCYNFLENGVVVGQINIQEISEFDLTVAANFYPLDENLKKDSFGRYDRDVTRWIKKKD